MEKLTWHTEKRKVKDLIPWAGNPRKLPPGQMAQLDKSLEKFDLVEIPAIDTDNRIIAGHMRTARLAFKGRGEEEIDVRVPNRKLTDEEFAEYNLRSNKNVGEFDWEALAAFDREMLLDVGFGAQDIDKILKAGHEKEAAKHKLSERFVLPPFSILDTKSGAWQARKKAWLTLTGILSETKEKLIWQGPTGGAPQYYTDKSKFEQFLGRKISNEEYQEKYYELKFINDGTSGFDPVLAELMYTWFAPKGGRILDPFGGEQTKGVVAGELKMQYTAVEFREDQVKVNQEATKEYPGVRYFCGDSNKLDELVSDDGYDLLFTSPPYYDLEVYSKEDMSALGTYEEFMAQYKNIFAKAIAKLKDGAFVVVKIGEVRDKKTGIYRNFVGDNIRIMEELGLKYYNEMILINAIGTLPIRTPVFFNAARKIGKHHQNVLAFFKGPAEQLFKESHAIYAAHQNILAFVKGDTSAAGALGPVTSENDTIEAIIAEDNGKGL